MKRTAFLLILSTILFFSCNNNRSRAIEVDDNKKTIDLNEPTKAKKINTLFFEQNIFDFRNEKSWKFKGNKPTVIDFYAEWCGPCKQLAPLLDELAQEYNGKVDFFKVDVDSEEELSYYFGIESIPCLMFIPMTGQPEMHIGAYPKKSYIQIIETTLLNNNISE